MRVAASELIDHAKIASTGRYAHLDDSALLEAEEGVGHTKLLVALAVHRRQLNLSGCLTNDSISCQTCFRRGAMMAETVFTIGYEGAEVGPFIATLAEAGVTHVIDIRDVPASRKRGFSKSALSCALEEQGIGYTHLKPLGDPKAGREAMRRGDYEAFLEIYKDHINQPAARISLGEAVNIALEEPSALLCYERDPKHCHRTLVAGLMTGLASFTIRHLGVNSRNVRLRMRGADGAESRAAYAVG